MPLVNTVTATTKVGPGLTMTSQVFNNVDRVDLQISRGTVEVHQTDPDRITGMSYAGLATMTVTIAAGGTTIVMST